MKSDPAQNVTPRRVIDVVAAIVEHQGRYLITQRRPSASLPLLWEFPGGRVEASEVHVTALIREIHHRLGVAIQVGALINQVNHDYEHYRVNLSLYECTLSSIELERKNVHDFRWVTSLEFDSIAFTAADEQSMNLLLGLPLVQDSKE